MFIKLGLDGAVSLEDRDNFKAFKIVVEGGRKRLEQARRALANVAELDDDSHGWVFEKALRARPEVAGDTAWADNLGKMIEKAKPHGWIDESRQAIKAHIEWTET